MTLAHSRRFCSAVLLASSFSLGGCGSVPFSGPPVNAAGTYSGSWHSSILTGGLSMTLTQQGAQVSGTATLSGTLCLLTSATVTGTVNGNQLNGALQGGTVSVSLSGIVSNGAITGNFSTPGGGVCAGASGTFDLELQQ